MARLEFNEETHTYTLGDKKLISTTQLLKKHGLAPDYSFVSEDVLRTKADYGTLVHKEIEEFIKERKIGFSNELQLFMNRCMKDKIDLNMLDSEKMVNNDVVAGTIDLLLIHPENNKIIDIKTTSNLNYDSVRWQLSIYAYLNDKDNYYSTELQVYHFKDNKLKVVDIPQIPLEKVERLIECERTNTEFVDTKEEIVSAEIMNKISVLENSIIELETKKKSFEEELSKLKENIISAMENNGVKSFENDLLKITFVAPTIRTTIDTTRLKKELPSVAKDFEKTSETKPSLRITIKESKKDE